MADSDKGKQAKSSLGDVQQNKLEGIASKTESNNSLDDLLSFDARILAASSATVDDVLAEKSVNQQAEPDLDAYDTKSEFAKEVELISDEFFDTDYEPEMPGVEQQEGYRDSTDASGQEKRISQLEHELSVLKKVSFSGLVLAVLGLGVSVWFAMLNSDAQLKPVEEQQIIEQQRLEMTFDERLIAPEMDSPAKTSESGKVKISESEMLKATDSDEGKAFEDEKTKVSEADKAITPETETQSLEKTLILSEEDISEIKTAEDVVEQKGLKVVVKGWAVNLNSYPNRDETNKKMQELRKKRIPVEMIIVNVNGVQWFRIRVTGFKTEAEAESYADKIAKALGRGHAWVSEIYD